MTSSDVINSKGQQILTTNKYPDDYSGTAVYDQMISRNMISALVNSKTEIVNTPSNIPVAEKHISYVNTSGNNFLPVSIEQSVKGSSLEAEGTIDIYDANGNILQFTNKAGITTAVIWGYNYQYPVAQIVEQLMQALLHS